MRMTAFAGASPLLKVSRSRIGTCTHPRMQSSSPPVTAKAEAAAPTWLGSVLDNAGTASSRLAAFQEEAALAARASDIPGRRVEAWRFTDLRALYELRYAPPTASDSDIAEAAAYAADLAPAECGTVLTFVDGVFCANASKLDADVERVKAAGGYIGGLDGYEGDTARLFAMFAKQEVSPSEGGLFAAVGSAAARDMCVVHLPEGFAVERPLGVVNVTTGGDSVRGASISGPKMAFLAGPKSECMLLESHSSWNRDEQSWACSLSGSAFDVAEGASVVHYLVNDFPDSSHHLSHVHANVGKDASYKMRMVSLGGKLGRLNLGIDLNDEGGHGEALGVMVADGQRIADLHSRISHNAPSCTSKQYQKNIATERGRVVFSGRIIVNQVAQETSSEQLCKSMLLADGARVDAMPILEISADQVQCTHGATISDLSQEELFYCQSRGVSRIMAQELLLASFAADVLEDCPFQSIPMRMAQLARKLVPTIQQVDTTERDLFQSV